jgi:hypothetical protein
MKVSDLISRTVPKPVPRARNLDVVGWCDGYLLVRFKGRRTLYVFGPAIPEAELQKILANPFPDRIFTTNIKNKYRCHKAAA